MNDGLRGQWAVLTGAGGGIGRKLAQQLAQAGANLVLTGRTTSTLEQAAELVRAAGCEALVAPADVTDEADVERLVQQAQEAAGGAVDIVINNAAAFARGAVQDLPVAEWDRVLTTNLRGPFLVSRALLPAMIERRAGAVVMVSSTSGKKGDPGAAAYAASKFGLQGLAQSLMYDVRGYNIRVMTCCPSSVDTSENGSPTRLCAEDVASAIVSALLLPPRALVREIELWATNPS